MVNPRFDENRASNGYYDERDEEYRRYGSNYTGDPHHHPRYATPHDAHVPYSGALSKYFKYFLIGAILFFLGGIVQSSIYFGDSYSNDVGDVFAITMILMNIGLLICAYGFALGGFKDPNLTFEERMSFIKASSICILAGAILNRFFFLGPYY